MQLLNAVDHAGRDHRPGPRLDLEIGNPREPLLQEHLYLAPCENSARADVRPIAECSMADRRGPVEIDLERIGVSAIIQTVEGIGDLHKVALVQAHPVEFDIMRDLARSVGKTVPAYQLLDGILHDVRVGNEAMAHIRMQGQVASGRRPVTGRSC